MNVQSIKGYELRERLGAGGFGAVYKAYQSTVGREVAIKIILPGLANQPDFIRRFEGEAQLVARLEHPYIIPLYDYWRDPEGAYLVMRWLRGGSLHDALKNGPFELPAVALMLDQLAGALSLAHRNGVIHRDIKPPNILLDDDGNAYLTDFGIAKDLNLPTNHTQQDAIVGSLDYISPEQARSEAVTARTDIYSLGVTLFEAITGHHPFQNMSPIERLYKHINDPLPEIEMLETNLREQVNRVIQKATAKNPEQRYPDALALAADFREAIGMNRSSTTIEELLTQREHEILQLIIDGMSNKEIAQRLTLSLGTVKWHANQIYSKLGVRSRVQAIVRARELNLIVKSGEAILPVSVATEDFHPQNPYKGLLAFQAADNQDFFGRERIISKLLKRLGESGEYSHFLAVVGPSGSGKSSLVKAGLIPALWRGELPGSEKWFVVEMLPSAHPLDELEVALTRIAANQASNLNEQLRRDKRGLVRAAGLILPADNTELVLVIDQFEEIFTLVEDEAERIQFLDLLHTAITEARSRVRIIITLRADFYDRPLHYPEFGELVRSQLETIMPLSSEELERAIARPAERLGLAFEQGLVAAIIGDVNYQPGALPLLQYALTELFEKRQGRLLTQDAYLDIGKTVGALANRAEEIYLSLSSRDKELSHQIFLRLVTLGEGTEDTRRRTLRSELLGIQEDSENVEELLDSFAAYRLLSLDNDSSSRQPTVEIAHEALIREWERLKAWLNESRSEIQMQRQLSSLTREWKESKREKSFLARGSRLESFEKWAAKTTILLTPIEREFISKSVEVRQADAEKEAEQQMRENVLKQRSQRFLQALVVVFAFAAFIAGGLSILAFALNNESRQNEAEFRSIALMVGANEALNNGQADVALALAQEAITMENPPQQAVSTFINVASSTWIRNRFVLADTFIWDAVYHPDGERIITSSWDGQVTVWSIATGEVLQSISRTSRPTNIMIHPDGNIVIVGGDKGLLQIWNLATNAVIEQTIGEDWHNAGTFTRDGRQMVTTDGRRILLWDLETLVLIKSWEAHSSDAITSVYFNADESLLVSTSMDNTVKIWDFATGELLKTLVLSAWGWNAQFLRDSNYVIVAADAMGVLLWNWQSEEIIWTIDGFRAQDIAISPDEQTFVVGTGEPDATVQLRYLDTGNLIRLYEGHSQRVQNVDFSPDGQFLLSGSNDGTAIIWPVNWEDSATASYIPEPVFVAAHPSQAYVAIIEDVDGNIIILNTNTGIIEHRLTGHSEGAFTRDKLSFSPDGRYLLSADTTSNDTTIYIWDTETWTKVRNLKGHIGGITMAISADSRTLAVGETESFDIVLWSLITGEHINVLEGHRDEVYELVFAPDNRYLYSAARDGSLFKWDLQSYELSQEFIPSQEAVYSIDISQDGSQLLRASGNIVDVLKTDTGETLFTLSGHSEVIFDTQYSPDYRYIMTASLDGLLILWDAQSGEWLRSYATNNDRVISPDDYMRATFNFDGGMLIAVSPSTDTAIISNISLYANGIEAWIHENRYIPDFTCEQRELYRIEPLCDI